MNQPIPYSSLLRFTLLKNFSLYLRQTSPCPAVSSQLPPSDPPSSTLPLPRIGQEAETWDPHQRCQQLSIGSLGETKASTYGYGRGGGRGTHTSALGYADSRPTPPLPRTWRLHHHRSRHHLLPWSKENPESRNTERESRSMTIRSPPPKGFDSDPLKREGRPKPKKKPGVHSEPEDGGQLPSASASTSWPRSNAKDLAHWSAVIIEVSEEEGGSPHLPRRPDPESPLLELVEPTGLVY
jgi:hypothetical protein